MIDETEEMKKKMSAFMNVSISKLYNQLVFLSKVNLIQYKINCNLLNYLNYGIV